MGPVDPSVWNPGKNTKYYNNTKNLRLDFFCILHAYTGLACSDSAGKCEGKEQGKNKEEGREREPGEKCLCVCVSPFHLTKYKVQMYVYLH